MNDLCLQFEQLGGLRRQGPVRRWSTLAADDSVVSGQLGGEELLPEVFQQQELYVHVPARSVVGAPLQVLRGVRLGHQVHRLLALLSQPCTMVRARCVTVSFAEHASLHSTLVCRARFFAEHSPFAKPAPLQSTLLVGHSSPAPLGSSCPASASARSTAPGC